MTGLVFEEPPPQRPGLWGLRMAEELAPLRSRPGEWARLRSRLTRGKAYGYVGQINSGTYAGIERGEFEATSRKVDGEGHHVWVRYVGGAS